MVLGCLWKTSFEEAIACAFVGVLRAFVFASGHLPRGVVAANVVVGEADPSHVVIGAVVEIKSGRTVAKLNTAVPRYSVGHPDKNGDGCSNCND